MILTNVSVYVNICDDEAKIDFMIVVKKHVYIIANKHVYILQINVLLLD